MQSSLEADWQIHTHKHTCRHIQTHRQFKTVFIDGHFKNALGVCSPVLKSVAACSVRGGTAGGNTFSLVFSAGSPEIKGGGRMAEQGRERNRRKALAHNVLLSVKKKTKGEAGGGVEALRSILAACF